MDFQAHLKKKYWLAIISQSIVLLKQVGQIKLRLLIYNRKLITEIYRVQVAKKHAVLSYLLQTQKWRRNTRRLLSKSRPRSKRYPTIIHPAHLHSES